METARFMAGLYNVDEKIGKVSVLDAGAGSGILSCAFIERLETIDFRFRRLNLPAMRTMKMYYHC